jgi:hypothetical protein
MSAKLDSRIKVLEGKNAPDDVRTIHIVFVSPPGKAAPRVTAIRSKHQRWERKEGESLEALRERASSECQRKRGEVVLLFET